MKLARSLTFAAVAIGVTALTVPAYAGADWSMYRGDAQHTGRSTAVVDPLKLQHAWQSPLGYRSPVIAGDLVYAHKWRQSGLPIGAVTAFDRITGAVRWTTGDLYHSVSPVTVANGMVIYQAEGGSVNKVLVVRDAATGALRYNVPLSYADNQTAVTVYTDPGQQTTEAFVSSSGTTAFTLGATSASKKWDKQDGWSSYGTPVVTSDGGAVLATTYGNGRAYNRADGTISSFYNSTVTGGLRANVSFDSANRRIFVSTGSAYQYNSSSGITPLWSGSTTSDDPPTIAENGNLFGISGYAGHLVETNGATGQVVRSSAADGFLDGDGPVLQQDFLWVSGQRGQFAMELRVVDRQSFQVLRTFPTGDAPSYTVFSPPALADGTAAIAFRSVNEYMGFDVYLEPGQVPEPAGLMSVAFPLAGMLRRRRQPAQRGLRNVERGWRRVSSTKKNAM